MKIRQNPSVNAVSIMGLRPEDYSNPAQHWANMDEARAAVIELIEAAETAAERLDEEGRSSKALRAALARIHGGK